jgi:hypothetical protein
LRPRSALTAIENQTHNDAPDNIIVPPRRDLCQASRAYGILVESETSGQY